MFRVALRSENKRGGLIVDVQLSGGVTSRWRVLRARAAVCALAALIGLGGQTRIAVAESISEALASAYRSNPDLNAERAALRAVDEEVPRALSGIRPTIIGRTDYGHRSANTGPRAITDGNSGPFSYSIQLNQPIFRGFRTLNATNEAEAAVLAARENLRTVEQTTLLDAATAYVNVLRDQAIVRLRQKNVEVLSRDLQATKDRFEVGEVTRTDVAQSEARRAGAVSDLNGARADLQASRAAYRQVIGRAPMGLRKPAPIDHLLPATLEGAVSQGLAENPVVVAAVYQEQAANFAVSEITGELLPEVSLEATYTRGFNPNPIINDTEETRVFGRVTVPFYQAGEVSARVRQAKEIVTQRQEEIEEARSEIRANVVAAWGVLVAARAQIIADRSQVSANTVALKGVREEEKVGQRTVLDVLDAEQELLDAQVNLATSERNQIVAAYALLAASGRLHAFVLKLPVELYDPLEHYDAVKYKFFGLSAKPRGYGGVAAPAGGYK